MIVFFKFYFEGSDRITCGNQPIVPHAIAVLASTTGKFYPGDYAMYACQENYLISGSNVITCQSDGTFTSSPVCKGSCGVLPPSIANAKVSSQSYRVKSEIGDHVVFECLMGYEMKEGVSNTSYCLESLKWSEGPACNPIPTTTTPRPPQGCGRGPKVEFSSVIDRSFQEGSNSSHGDTMTFKCQNGYDMQGRNTIACIDGTWTEIPTCKPNPLIRKLFFFSCPITHVHLK